MEDKPKSQSHFHPKIQLKDENKKHKDASGRKKRLFKGPKVNGEIRKYLYQESYARAKRLYQSATVNKENRVQAEKMLMEKNRAKMDEEFPNEPAHIKDLAMGSMLKKAFRSAFMDKNAEQGKRYDGREVDDVRPIDIRTSILPMAHGSALFSRGDTQALCTVTIPNGLKSSVMTLTSTFPTTFLLAFPLTTSVLPTSP